MRRRRYLLHRLGVLASSLGFRKGSLSAFSKLLCSGRRLNIRQKRPHAMTAFVMIFGRRRITKDAEHSGPAYENRQRTKPREKVRAAGPRSAYQRAPEAGFLYNLSVMA